MFLLYSYPHYPQVGQHPEGEPYSAAWLSAICLPCVSTPRKANAKATASIVPPRNTKAGKTAAAVALGAMTLSLPASSAKASGPRILPTPLAACPSPDEREPRLTPYCSTVYGARFEKPPSAKNADAATRMTKSGKPSSSTPLK